MNDIVDNISILVNNVGVLNCDSFHTVSPNDIYEEVAVNCYPIVMLSKLLLEGFERRFKKKGVRSLIINISSFSSMFPLPLLANYAATKVFDDYMSKGLYYELKSKGIDVLSA
jgi:short-subunit dehydrogenase